MINRNLIEMIMVIIKPNPGKFHMSYGFGTAVFVNVVCPRMAVYWPLAYRYFPGTVNSINYDGKHVAMYDEDYVKT